MNEFEERGVTRNKERIYLDSKRIFFTFPTVFERGYLFCLKKKMRTHMKENRIEYSQTLLQMCVPISGNIMITMEFKKLLDKV